MGGTLISPVSSPAFNRRMMVEVGWDVWGVGCEQHLPQWEGTAVTVLVRDQQLPPGSSFLSKLSDGLAPNRLVTGLLSSLRADLNDVAFCGFKYIQRMNSCSM